MGDTDIFAKHQVDKPIPVQQLTKCRMQDNLEFLQWTKKFWDQHFPGDEYDAVGRRKGVVVAAGGGGGAPTRGGGAGGRVTTTSSNSSARRSTPTTAVRPRAFGAGGGGGGGGGGGVNSAALQQENSGLRDAVASLEKERDFYFAKLRDIELLLQAAMEEDPELEKEDHSLSRQIQSILYSTEVCTSLMEMGTE